MPRSSRRSSSSAPSRSSSSSSVPAKTSAAPPVPGQQQRSPGFLSQVASTAAGVAGGHAISNMLFGGRGETAPAEAPQNQSFEQQSAGGACTLQAKDFTQCLTATGNDIASCQYYLEQLKSCQQAAAAY